MFVTSMPWATDAQDAAVFRRWLTTAFAFVIIFGVVIPLLPVPEVSREQREALPAQLAEIIMPKPKVKPPPPPKPKPKAKPKPKPKPKQVAKPKPRPKPKQVAKPKPKPKPKPKQIAKPKPKPKPQSVASARQKAKASGVLAFRDQLADMREALDVNKLNTGAIQRGSGRAARADRSLITAKHGGRSAGVNIAALSRETGGVALSGRETTRVRAPRAEVGGGSGGRRTGGSGARGAGRSIEDIRRVFDANKGAIYSIYNRALRKNPSLEGKLVLELTIEPSGVVSNIRVISSEMNDKALVAKLVSRIQMFNFGQRSVSRTKINYPVHFLPT
jgi:outer membrane biosynthesis protein TonB